MKMSLFKEMSILEGGLTPEFSEFLYGIKCKLPCVGPGALYTDNSCTVLVTTEEWEWGRLTLELAGEYPPNNHWLYHEFQNFGSFEDILGIRSGTDETERFLLEHGIAPFQDFYMHLEYDSWRDYWGEYDSEVTLEVLNIEPWDSIRICTEWEAFWARKRMIMPWETNE